MAIKVPCNTTGALGIEEYLEYITAHVDVRDMDSLVASAPKLRALANDRTLVIRELNSRIENYLAGGALPSAQTLLLGRREGFFVRANIWPAIADMASGRAYQDQFSYNLAHDHNFSFMTVNYLGAGYETEIYEYDCEKVEGYIGEHVDLRFLEKVRFGTDMAMVYRASRDVHVQYPPSELTITLNLMVADPDYRLRDQYVFDLGSRTIVGYPPDLAANGRISLVTIAGHVGDGNTGQLLGDLAAAHPCRRTRLSAYESWSRRQPHEAQSIWEKATSDKSPLVANTALRKLRAFERG